MSRVRTKSGLCCAWLTLALVAGLSGCSGDGGTTVEPGPIVTVFITPDGATLAQVGESIQLQATTLDAVGRIVNSALITWHQLAGGDVATIAAACGGAILVVEAEKTRQEVVEEAKRVLEVSGVDLLGDVLNRRKYHIPEVVYRRL